MNETNYYKKLNEHTLLCHGIIVWVLEICYILEVIKGNRSPLYMFYFSLSCLTPWIVELIMHKRRKDFRGLKYIFVFGYALFYTFVMFSGNSVMVWVYVLPMVSVLICYGDVILILALFGYAILLNALTTGFQLEGLLPYLNMTTAPEHITAWEIQFACLTLTGVFLYFSTKLVRERSNIIFSLLDDVYEDALTGCKNVRFYSEIGRDLFDYNFCTNLCICFIDVDDFKNFNTVYGHTFGDMVLKEIGNILNKTIIGFPNTYAIRMGGDEFIVISKSLGYDDFLSIVEKIRNTVSKTIVEFNGQSSSVNVTIGVSSKSKDKGNRDLHSLYELADDRNRKAKKEGKNKVEA